MWNHRQWPLAGDQSPGNDHKSKKISSLTKSKKVYGSLTESHQVSHAQYSQKRYPVHTLYAGSRILDTQNFRQFLKTDANLGCATLLAIIPRLSHNFLLSNSYIIIVATKMLISTICYLKSQQFKGCHPSNVVMTLLELCHWYLQFMI
jgi:hypothetical protein